MSFSSVDSGTYYTNSSISNCNNIDESNDSCNSSISNISSSDEEIVIGKDVFITPYAKYEDSWFKTENKLSLSNYIKKLFSIVRSNLLCNVESDTTKAILVPHSGIRYSGLCAASSYYELNNRTRPIKNIILLCTSHRNLSTESHSLADSKKNTELCLNIMAPSFSKISTTKKGKYLAVDTQFINNIKHLIKMDDTKGTFFQQEHSFFNQIPFLELVAPDAQICPLLIGNILTDSSSGELNTKTLKRSLLQLQVLIKILKDKLTQNNTVLICSSDFAHVNGDGNGDGDGDGNGNFNTKISSHIFQNIRRLDNETLNFLYNIVDGNESRNSIIDTVLFMQNSSTCGIMAIYLFGKVLNALQSFFRNNRNSSSSDSGSDFSIKSLIKGTAQYNKIYYSRISCYYSSITRELINILNDKEFDKKTLVPLYEIRGNTKSSVSYIGLIYTNQPYIQSKPSGTIAHMLTQYEELALLGLAREQLFYHLLKTHQNISMPTNLIKPIYSQTFGLELGVFTTLRNKRSELRGCIGTLETNNDEFNIESNIKKYIIEAATHDPRFSPVDLADFYELDINITILNELAPITLNQYFTNKFQLGRDGILMKLGQKQGYFLPSVAMELGLKPSEKNKLLDELCIQKIAGCDTKTAFRKYSNSQLFYNEGLEFHF
jgi:uncharacterized protein (TIGR00296 family)/AmmeMemoRadiSam system protein B